jgi:hypothetical protein
VTTVFSIIFGLLGGLAVASPLIIIALVKKENLRHRLFRRRMRRGRSASSPR